MTMRVILGAMLSLLALSARVVVGAADYQVVRDRSARGILPGTMLKGQSYRVRDVVPTDGYTNRWKVDSDFGPFEADGDGALRKLIGEIYAIAELKKVSRTEAFAHAAGRHPAFSQGIRMA